jgi:Glycosyltransferase family 87
VLVAGCAAVAWRPRSPVVPRVGGTVVEGTAWAFLILLVTAFALYLVALAFLRRGAQRLAAVAVIAVAVQLAPLGAPLLLSTDAWTYWDYGRIAAVHGGNPYVDRPDAYPHDPALAQMGAHWRDKTSVYGPAFTLASEPVAHAVGSSRDAAAWVYKVIAALAALAAAALAAMLARRRALAVAFVGWNPILSVHLAGGGHNDAWIGLLVLGALALAASRRATSAGASWALAIAVKWVPLVFLALHLLEARARARKLGAVGLVGSAAVLAALAGWRYGWRWLAALAPLADNARLETRYALPHRLESAGVPRDAALGLAIAVLALGLAWLVRRAADGRARHALAACLLLVTTPYLAVWYLGWAVPLAAADEDDRLARVGVLVLCAYLLPQTIPL